MSLDDLILEARRRGYLVNNLYQTDSGTWTCNLRPKGAAPNLFRSGVTAAEALRKALAAAPDAYPDHVEPIGDEPVRASEADYAGGVFG